MSPRKLHNSRALERKILPGKPLTDREVAVVRLAAQGLRNDQIAQALSCKPNTIKSHLARISIKTGLRGRTLLVSYAHREGLIDRTPVEDEPPAPPPVPVTPPAPPGRVPPALKARARTVVPADGSCPEELLGLYALARRRVMTPEQYRWLRAAWNVLMEVADVSWERRNEL